MANIFEIAFANCVKFYKNTSTPGVNFDDDWFYNQIKPFETKRHYFAKWQKSDTIIIQMLSTFTDVSIKIYDAKGKLITSTAAVFICYGNASAYGVYQCNLPLAGLAEGIYFLLAVSKSGATEYKYVSEPIQVKTFHKNTSLFRYSNSINDFGMVFQAIVFDTNAPYQPEFTFRCEAAVMDPSFERERSAYRDQILNTTTQSATPFRQFKLWIGEAPGVAPWAIDILNRIISCDRWLINDKQFETPDGSKWEYGRLKGAAGMGSAIDLLEAQNRSSLQISSDNLPDGSQNAAYTIDTSGGEIGGPGNNIIQINTTE